MDTPEWTKIEALITEIVQGQHEKLFAMGRKIVPQLTEEDLLQPNDYPELENHPHFRYEEGVLAGIQTVEMALRAFKKSQKNP